MEGIPAKLTKLLGLLDGLQDRADRIQFLIDISGRFPRCRVPERIATLPFTEDHRVPACESEAYVWAEDRPDGTLKFHFAVENPQGISAMATAVILDETLSEAPLEEVARVPGEIIYTIFGDELSMGKSLGLSGIVSMVQNFAKKRLSGTA